MLLKKYIDFGSHHNVHYANGKVTLGKISLNVYCFMVDGVLIDTGSRSLSKQFEPFLLEADIDQVVLTHIHEDHTGCASILEQQRNVPIYIHEMSVQDCEKNPDYPLYRKVFWGKRMPFRANAIDSSFSSRSADWEVIKTPGHAKDHLAFLNKETGQLFTGDLYVQTKTKVVLREESIPTIIRSIEHLLTYDFNEMYCSHAGFVKDGRKSLENKKDYLSDIQQQVKSRYQEGLSPEQIHDSLFKRKYPITKLSRGEWDSLHIVTSIIDEMKQEVS
ncbi:MBL fold metallo-hydrolase [Ureibacillus aquaedulcis]|uniref:MBL fold metallo-hydrolase n=1 Tax=Ureibacillus aquaedulcis TaxID=3058421 RepID=A0ABT8GQW3_9BACL|nr:MBL fold metallo-hydrolase [Ureibacillus sp. BA0131]MDN4493806.1 MBL fold metallo-hydrolase [Ureibacillus sp. BA0131]